MIVIYLQYLYVVDQSFLLTFILAYQCVIILPDTSPAELNTI